MRASIAGQTPEPEVCISQFVSSFLPSHVILQYILAIEVVLDVATDSIFVHAAYTTKDVAPYLA